MKWLFYMLWMTAENGNSQSSLRVSQIQVFLLTYLPFSSFQHRWQCLQLLQVLAIIPCINLSKLHLSPHHSKPLHLSTFISSLKNVWIKPYSRLKSKLWSAAILSIYSHPFLLHWVECIGMFYYIVHFISTHYYTSAWWDDFAAFDWCRCPQYS